MNILQVNTRDATGGAASVAWNLHQAYGRRGHRTWLAVGNKWTHDAGVLPIRHSASLGRWGRAWQSAEDALQSSEHPKHGQSWSRQIIRTLAEPRHALDWWRGVEDFNFRETWGLLELPPTGPDILHCHNLHGGYFDLRALPELSRRVPLVLTLHDAWPLSGHCAQSFDCERWRRGCGQCPDLTIYPAIRRDGTAFNWQRKKEIYAKSQLHVATPSHWLMRKVEESILASGIVDARVIPNGVDLTVFHPADKEAARSRLGIPIEARMILFTAQGIRRSIWRDFQTARAAVALLQSRLHGNQILFVALGEDAPPERIDGAEVRFVPYEPDPRSVASYYQAADVYMHPARADTFPLTVLEALACGVPVVATSVGGIPEQVVDGRTGLLVPPGDAEALAGAVGQLLTDEALRHSYAREARKDAEERFDLERQIDAYLGWYRDILAHFGSNGTAPVRADSSQQQGLARSG